MSDKVTPENILDKLRLHPREQTPAVCMVAGQELTRLRAELDLERKRLDWVFGQLSPAEEEGEPPVIQPKLLNLMQNAIKETFRWHLDQAMKETRP